jgi:DNA modification methylase
LVAGEIVTEIVVGKARVFHGDCREVLRGLPDNSIDSVVTDPPYELGFMGKKWDSTGIAYDVTVWEECLRVLKPGGHVLAFGGSRTFHRMAVAIEDAGFEIRDSIAWMYGSGFPKSLDVSKAIDKRGGSIAGQSEFAGVLATAKAESGLTIGDLNETLGKRTSNLWSHFVGEIQPLLPTTEQYRKLKGVLPIPDGWDELFLPEAERVVTGKGSSGKTAIWNEHGGMGEFDITAAHTPEAKQWEGWGTALKPAFEPIVVGRKPFAKGSTVAANVLEHGVGGLNIDASRIGSEPVTINTFDSGAKPFGGAVGEAYTSRQSEGRWPANVILDEYSAGLLDEQSGVQKDGIATSKPNPGPGLYNGGWKAMGDIQHGFGGSGGASRFFYCAKASTRDRNEGLDGLENTSAGDMVDRVEDSAGMNSPRAGAGRTSGAKNFHPTVKPTALMRYLIKLVTPAGGTVLDPFTGSGSTGKAALLDGYKFIGAELTEEYLPIIEGRLRWANEQEGETDERLF